ncbi:MAG: EAL domain-containing protein [Peptococcaceae bacterium]|nr:EAL domain-containing protein [Peptococcaceae bacterium]
MMKTYIYSQCAKDRASMVREPQMLAFHEAKYICYSRQRNPYLQERIAEQLQTALEEEQIQVFLQPRVNLKRETVCAAEALARWHWPDGSWHLPDEFLPALRQIGLMPGLDYYMLEQAARIQHQWLHQCDSIIPVSVNFSADTLLQPDAVHRITSILRQYHLETGQIELELTEHCLMEQQPDLVPILQQLNASGIPVCLDDFGAGSSSLSMLLELPVDYVKLDKRFLQKNLDDRRTHYYILKIIQLLQAAEVKVIAEGVETAEQAAFLRSLNVEEGQGWHWSRPLHWRMFMHHYVLDKAGKTCYYI